MTRDAVIYCRASQDRTGAGLSVAGQEADCRKFAAAHELAVREVFTDNDITASGNKRRPGYIALLADLQANPGTTVVIWHTDRLHRHLAKLENYIQLSQEHGVITRAVQAGDLDLATASGRMVARILGSVARQELEHMSERREAGKARAAAAGRWLGGNRPFGYKRIPGPEAAVGELQDEDAASRTFRWVVVDEEADLIASGTDDILKGTSVQALTRKWNASGVWTSTGGRWWAREVSRVLRRARNAGLVEHRGQVLPGVRAEWPAVVSEDDWRVVRAILTDPARRTQRGTEPRWLLSGLAICGGCDGACGAPMLVSNVGTRGRDRRKVYKCRTGGPGHVARDAELLDAYVTELVIAWLELHAPADLVRPASADGKAGSLRARLTSARQRLSQSAEMFGAGMIDAAQLTTITDRARADVSSLTAQLAAIEERDALAAFADASPRAVWESLDVSRRRKVVAALLTVTVLPARQGRPPGWKPGQPYFSTDPAHIRIDWSR